MITGASAQTLTVRTGPYEEDEEGTDDDKHNNSGCRDCHGCDSQHCQGK